MEINTINSIRYSSLLIASMLSIHHFSIAEPDPGKVKDYAELMAGIDALHLTYRDIIAKDAEALAEALKVNRTLTELDLMSNQMGDAGAQALAEALKNNETLIALNLRDNQIGDAGVQALAEALKVNRTLTALGLGYNQIGDARAQALAEAIRGNEALTALYLCDNQIGDAGAQALAEALKGNKTLTKLNLSDNQIGDAGAKALAEAIRGNKTLTKLNLSSNSRIGDVGCQAHKEIREQLDINKRLKIPLKSWPRVKHMFMEYNDAGTLFSTLPKEIILKILETVMDIEALSAKRQKF